MKKGLLILLSLFAVFSVAGCKDATAEVEGEALNYEEVKGKVSDKEKELKKVKSELKETNTKLEDNKEELEELKKLRDNRGKIKDELGESRTTLNDIKTQIKDAESELASLTGEIEKTGDEPIELGAGKYTFGDDVPTGRYEVFPQGRGSNFVVFDEFGELDVNQILGDGGVPSYVFEVYDGATVETEAPVKLVPVK